MASMNYELLVEPRSLFAADGQMLHCSTKSNLVTLLGNLLEGTKVKKVEEEGRNRILGLSLIHI